MPSLGVGLVWSGQNLDLRFGVNATAQRQAYVDKVSITSDTAAPAMLINGSFELIQAAGGSFLPLGTSLALLGWTPSSTSGTYLWHSYPELPDGPTDGQMGVLLTGTNTLTQALGVTLVPYGEYSAGIDVARRTTTPSNGGTLLLFAGDPSDGGILIDSTSVSGTTLTTNPGYFFSATPFNVTTADALALGASLGDRLYLQIAGSGTQTVFDNVSFTFAIPEPTSLALLGLGGLALLKRRR